MTDEGSCVRALFLCTISLQRPLIRRFAPPSPKGEGFSKNLKENTIYENAL